MKYFRMSYGEVVYNRSYINIMLLNRSIPSFGSNDEEEEDDEILTEDGGIVTGRKKKRKKDRPMHSSEYFMQFM